MVDPPKSGASSSCSIEEMTSKDFQEDINAHFDVARERLTDEVSISIFKEAILTNRHIFRGRIVLDVNCGLGILSLFAAQAGAEQVYAVDPSKITDYTRRIVAANGFDDVIHVITSKVQMAELPVNKVDIIISNWMGHSLLFQSVCDAVIFARNKWLKKGGVILPDIAKLFVAAVEDKQSKKERIDWWNKVYGFKMNCMRKFALSAPFFEEVKPGQIISTDFCVKTLDMNRATYNDLKIHSKFLIEMKKDGYVDGVATYFIAFFSKTHKPLQIRTFPGAASTQWLQSVFFFNERVLVECDQTLFGSLEMKSLAPKDEVDLNKMELVVNLKRGPSKAAKTEAAMRWVLKPLTEPSNYVIKPTKCQESKEDEQQENNESQSDMRAK